MFFSHFVNELYTYSYADSMFICGDLNARIGNKCDHIMDIDDIPPRISIDEIVNWHGKSLLDSKFCILNGRICPENDKYTFLSSRENR